jgi:hypothetical protein
MNYPSRGNKLHPIWAMQSVGKRSFVKWGDLERCMFLLGKLVWKNHAVALYTLLASTILNLVQDAKLLVIVMNPVDQLRKELWCLVGY